MENRSGLSSVSLHHPKWYQYVRNLFYSGLDDSNLGPYNPLRVWRTYSGRLETLAGVAVLVAILISVRFLDFINQSHPLRSTGFEIIKVYHPLLAILALVVAALLVLRTSFCVAYHRTSMIHWASTLLLAGSGICLLTHIGNVQNRIMMAWGETPPEAAPQYRLSSSTFMVDINCTTFDAHLVREQYLEVIATTPLTEIVETDLTASNRIEPKDIRFSIFEILEDGSLFELPSRVGRYPQTGPDSCKFYSHVFAAFGGLQPGKHYVRRTEIRARDAYKCVPSDYFAVVARSEIDNLSCEIKFSGYCAIDHSSTSVKLLEELPKFEKGGLPLEGSGTMAKSINECLVSNSMTTEGSTLKIECNNLRPGNCLRVDWNYIISPGQGTSRPIAGSSANDQAPMQLQLAKLN